MQIIYVFILKIIDNGLSTAKTIYLHKEKFFLGAMLNAIATFFYLIAIVQITKDNSLSSIISMCIATFIGTYIPGILIKKSERDKLYIYDITTNNFNDGIKFADDIRDMNIAIKTYTSYDSYMNKVLSCKVYSMSKDESKIINKYIPKSFKYHIYASIND